MLAPNGIQHMTCLTCALQYWKTINAISADWEMGLCQFELSEKEWNIATQLRDMLKVSLLIHLRMYISHSIDLKGCHPFLLLFHVKLSHYHTCYGHHWREAYLDSLDYSRFDPSICASLGLTKTLNWYYNMINWSEVYRIAMDACAIL